MFKNNGQRAAFFEALKNKGSGQIKNPVLQPAKTLPVAMPTPGAQSPPSMSSAIGKPPGSGLNADPATVKPPNPMQFLKIRRALKPKV